MVASPTAAGSPAGGEHPRVRDGPGSKGPIPINTISVSAKPALPGLPQVPVDPDLL